MQRTKSKLDGTRTELAPNLRMCRNVRTMKRRTVDVQLVEFYGCKVVLVNQRGDEGSSVVMWMGEWMCC